MCGRVCVEGEDGRGCVCVWQGVCDTEGEDKSHETDLLSWRPWCLHKSAIGEKLTEVDTHTLCQCQALGFDTQLQLCKTVGGSWAKGSRFLSVLLCHFLRICNNLKKKKTQSPKNSCFH